MADFSTVTVTPFGSLTGASYVSVLAALGASAGLGGSTAFVLKSSLDQDMLISFDGVTDHYILSAGERVVFDIPAGHAGGVSAKKRSASPTVGELIATSWGR